MFRTWHGRYTEVAWRSSVFLRVQTNYNGTPCGRRCGTPLCEWKWHANDVVTVEAMHSAAETLRRAITPRHSAGIRAAPNVGAGPPTSFFRQPLSALFTGRRARSFRSLTFIAVIFSVNDVFTNLYWVTIHFFLTYQSLWTVALKVATDWIANNGRASLLSRLSPAEIIFCRFSCWRCNQMLSLFTRLRNQLTLPVAHPHACCANERLTREGVDAHVLCAAVPPFQ